MDDIVERARWMANGEAKAGIGKVRGALFTELADEIEQLREQHAVFVEEIEKLRHPKIIVGSRKLWEAMGEIVSEAEIERLTEELIANDAADRLISVSEVRNDALEEAAKVVDEINKTGSWAYGDDIRALKEKP